MIHPRKWICREGSEKTVKNLLAKSNDPRVALMSYHSMPLENGYSLSKLLMGRKLRVTIPMITEQLLPSIPPKFVVKEKEVMIREWQQKNFNKHHCASPLKLLRQSDMVHIPDNEREGTIVEESSTLNPILCRHLKVSTGETTDIWCNYQLLRTIAKQMVLQTLYPKMFLKLGMDVLSSLQIDWTCKGRCSNRRMIVIT